MRKQRRREELKIKTNCIEFCCGGEGALTKKIRGSLLCNSCNSVNGKSPNNKKTMLGIKKIAKAVCFAPSWCSDFFIKTFLQEKKGWYINYQFKKSHLYAVKFNEAQKKKVFPAVLKNDGNYKVYSKVNDEQVYPNSDTIMNTTNNTNAKGSFFFLLFHFFVLLAFSKKKKGKTKRYSLFLLLICNLIICKHYVCVCMCVCFFWEEGGEREGDVYVDETLKLFVC